MDLKKFEAYVNSYLNYKSEADFIFIINSLTPYMISLITHTRFKHYDFDDLKQELEFKVFQSLNNYDTSKNCAWGYLTTTLKNKIYELYNHDKHLSLVAETVLLQAPKFHLDTLQDINILDSLNLTSIENKVIDLYYYQDYTLDKISIELNCSVSWIVKVKRSALKKLKILLEN